MLILGALVFVLVVPLLTALIALHRQHWFPVFDLAATEIRVRDVVSNHPPRIGLYSRLGYGAGGSHPGPLSFYLLWPVWALFGKSSFGLQAATVALDISAISLCVWIAYRRGGLALVAGITPVLAVLMRAYGAFLLTLPWNPYLPVLWWTVFLLAAWSILAGDMAILPIAAFAGTMCVQTHISYVGPVGGLALFVAATALYRQRRHGDAATRRHLVRWGATAAVLSAVLWTPPLVDELTRSPGNFSTIVEYFRHPPSASIGLHRGVDVLLSQIDPVKLLTQTLVRDRLAYPAAGPWLPGALLVLTWVVSVAVARRLRTPLLLQLDVVIGVGLVFGAVSVARIFGELFFYLLLWAWGLAALMIFAIGWTIAALVRTRVDDAAVSKIQRMSIAGATVVTIVVTVAFAHSAANVEVQSPHINASLAALAPPTARALHQMKTEGNNGPYLVTWLPDPEKIGSAGYGLVNELERRGLKVRTNARSGRYVPYATSTDVIDPARARIEVHLATGDRNIAQWRQDSRYREIAFVDPRSQSERAEFDRLRTEAIRELRDSNLGSKASMVDTNLFLLYLEPEIATHTRDKVARMIALDMPSAVFIGPSSYRP